MTDSAEQMLSTWIPGTTLDIHEQMMSLTLRVVMRALFDLETSDTQQISQNLNTVMMNSVGGRLLFLLLPTLAAARNAKVRRAVEQMNAAVYEIIRQRRNRTGESRDLVSMLMCARDEDDIAMSDDQLRDEVMTFLLAGHETTALTLSWALYLLSRNPGAASKLLQEIESQLGNRELHISDLSSLTASRKMW